MGFFNVLEDIVSAPIMLPLKAVNAAITLPGQLVKEVGSTALGIAGVAGKVASTGISASVRSVESISTTPFKSAQASVASVAGAVQGSVANVAGSAQKIGESLSTPAMIGAAAVLAILLLRER